jgi:hypothetical protein
MVNTLEVDTIVAEVIIECLLFAKHSAGNWISKTVSLL